MDKPVKPDQCVIWSGEHHAYWRFGDGQGNGYTTEIDDAGQWSRNKAERLTRHCGPEKQIEIQDAPSPRFGKWQPIETAPKDATPILVYIPSQKDRKPVQEVWWALLYDGGPGYWSTPLGPSGRGYTILPEAPTHWMPLPPPPAEP